MTIHKYVYSFGDGNSQGDASMKNLLGGKGANLAEMSKMGLPVPPGFTITTEFCDFYYKNDKKFPDSLRKEVAVALAQIEEKIGAKFGDEKNPLLFSVRSGARASMPGMALKLPVSPMLMTSERTLVKPSLATASATVATV